MKQKITLMQIIAIIVSILFVIILYKFLQDSKKINDEQIAQDIRNLEQIFSKINNSCSITAFRNERDTIDFLNVVKFAGSQIGSMNLLKPENWQGPYLEVNPTIEGKEYQIVKAKDGYYIIPGAGVKIGNGKVVDKTILIDSKTDMNKLGQDPKGLLSNGYSLAAKIPMFGKISNEQNSGNQPLLLDEEDAGSPY